MAKAQKNAAKATKANKSNSKSAKQTAKQQPAKVAPQTAKASTTNPFRVGGGYWCSVEALRGLGLNKMHAFDAIVPAVRKSFGSAWKAFAAKDARNDETGKDATARVLQNVSVVARKDYGKPLRELGFEVRFDGREKQAGIFKIGK